VVAELERNPGEPLAKSFLPRLRAATNALRHASEDRTRTVAATEKHRTSVVLLVDAVNRELDRTEGDLLRLFPGERARVASYLAATRQKKAEPEPASSEPVAAS